MVGVLIDEECPRCGDILVMREGRRGHSFVGCLSFPGCRYTRSIKEGEELKLYQPPPEFCPKCHNTGLIPFIKPDGTASKFAKVFCECHERDQHEYYPPLRPEDIDFACSRDWRSYFETMTTKKTIDIPSKNY